MTTGVEHCPRVSFLPAGEAYHEPRNTTSPASIITKEAAPEGRCQQKFSRYLFQISSHLIAFNSAISRPGT